LSTGLRVHFVYISERSRNFGKLGGKMIATLDRLMALNQKLHDAERTHESDPIYVALDLNEVHLLERTLEVYFDELDPMDARYARSSTEEGGSSIEAYD